MKKHDLDIAKSLKTRERFKQIVCGFCTAKCCSIEALALHIRDTHLPHIHYCEVCRRAFVDIDLYSKHKEKHRTTENTVFSCSNCKYLAENPEEIFQHDTEAHSTVQSAINGVKLENMLPHLSSLLNTDASEFVQNFMKNKNNIDVIYKCRCSYKSMNILQYLKHLKDRGCKSISCDKCCKTFANKTGFVVHLQNNTPCFKLKEGTMRFVNCTICNVPIMKNKYEKHVQFHRKLNKIHKKSKSFMCHECNIEINEDQEVNVKNPKNVCCVKCSVILCSSTERKHHENVHCASYKCIYCETVVETPELYIEHVQDKHGEDYQSYKYNCCKCRDVFDHPQKLFDHVTNHHRQVKLFTCDLCKEKFRLRVEFTYHIKQIHKGVGVIYFTKFNHVHFGKNIRNPQQPVCRQKLFTEDQEIMFKSLGVMNDSLEENETNCDEFKCSTPAHEVQMIDFDCLLEDNDTQESYNNSELLMECGILDCKTPDSLAKSEDVQSIVEDIQTLGIRKTIQKVNSVHSATTVTIKPIMTAKNFLEAFDSTENCVEKTDIKEKETVQTKLTLKSVKNDERGKINVINIVKCETVFNYEGKLSMPTKVINTNIENNSNDCVSIKLCDGKKDKAKLNYGSKHYDKITEKLPITKKEDENIVEKKFLIPKKAKEYGVKIGKLQTEEPFFKIIPMNDLTKPTTNIKSNKPIKQNRQLEVILPTGTKLVTTNPLQHFIRNKQLKILEPRKRYYVPKHLSRHQETALKNAFVNFPKPPAVMPPPMNWKRRKVVVKNNQAIKDEEKLAAVIKLV